MTDNGLDITRRKILGAVGTVGVASVGAGLGTTAFFNDTESFGNNIVQAGELDLVIDFEEHYSGAAPADDLEYVRYVDPDDANLETDEVGIPSQDNPLVAVNAAYSELPDPVKAYMDASAIDSFPDTDGREITVDGTDYSNISSSDADDGIQDDIPVNGAQGDDSAECAYLQPLVPDNGDILSSSSRTQGQVGSGPNPQTTDEGDPLVDISDAKPGDFGEVTFSLHNCGNPAYISISGELLENAENDLTEPEEEVDGTGNASDDMNGELLDEASAVIWYDAGEDNEFEDAGAEPSSDPTEGDNILQENETIIANANEVLRGNLGMVLDTLEGGIPLNGDLSTDFFEVVPESSNKEIDDISDFSNVLEPTDIDYKGQPDCEDINPEYSEVAKIEGSELESLEAGDTIGPDASTGGITITVDSVTRDSQTGEVLELEISTNKPITAVTPKGGSSQGGGNSGPGFKVYEEPDGATLTNVTFAAPKNKALSYLLICYEPQPANPAADEREPFVNSTTAYIGFAWYIDPDVGNEIQTDSMKFNLGFEAEQARNNDNPTV
ncbi:SipW-dependent-type signal peptide-containing protein [Salinirubrum litoreum]|uniref:SipW-dependent-type signal peptide-containing protein n=1 Tax=Salinirubrum litoreum TaxID=1126234 RepID=A0ABD5R9I1_9EURY|nr:SipW-dependent-type signal peptide-containing protein [Salinirubrum litoreum]